MTDLTTTPDDLPIPIDDGATDHLVGLAVPSVPLPATDGTVVDIGRRPGRTVLYIYPMTGRPDVALPDGWDAIPGARGCTPQSCAFRDHHADLHRLGVEVFGMSSQSTSYQQEAVGRLHLPFALLSDADLAFGAALDLPTMHVDIDHENATLLTRVTLIIRDGAIEHVFYPVFPTDRNAQDVIDWLTAHPM